MFSKLKHLIIVELYCNLRIYVITLLCGLLYVMYYFAIITSVMTSVIILMRLIVLS
jgi:hypothetical protein